MIKLPITLTEKNGDSCVYYSLADAEKAMEPIDVENGEYLARDAEGHLLRLQVVTEPRPKLFGLLKINVSKVKIEENEL